MKNLLPKAAALALVGAGLLAQSARANYAVGDLILSVQSGAGGSGNDFDVDLADSAATYQASTSDIVYQMNLSDLNTALSGSSTSTGWETTASWAVVGSTGTPNFTMYASKTESTPGVQNATGTTGKSQPTQTSAATGVADIGGNTAGAGTQGTVSDTASGKGWSKVFSSTSLGQVVAVSRFGSSGLTGSAADLSVTPAVNGVAGTVYGYFTWSIDAVNSSLVDFTYNVPAVAAPEPTTYGLFAGAGLLALCLGHQLRRKQQA